MYKKTNKKVKVWNGTKAYIRTVYVNDFGRECFRDEKEWHYIYEYTNRNGVTFPRAMFYNGVEYI